MNTRETRVNLLAACRSSELATEAKLCPRPGAVRISTAPYLSNKGKRVGGKDTEKRPSAAGPKTRNGAPVKVLCRSAKL